MQKKISSISNAVCVSGPCAARLPKSAMHEDRRGGFWCPEHRSRGGLLDWAIEHGFPAIAFRGQMRYAIGVDGGSDNEMLWGVALHLGSEDMINAALAYIENIDSQEVAS